VWASACSRQAPSQSSAADTRPSPEVVENAREADLIIHEVYGLKAEAERAHALGHPTAAEAGGVARDAGARRLMLTHFRASRFAGPEVLAAEAEACFGHPVRWLTTLWPLSFE
jgi:ribonuclease Z